MTDQVKTQTDEVRATVHFVDLNGQRGPYAKARVKGMGDVTFQLDDATWKSHEIPVNGAHVMLSGFQKKDSGWIATSGRLYTFADEKRGRRQHSNPKGES